MFVYHCVLYCEKSPTKHKYIINCVLGTFMFCIYFFFRWLAVAKCTFVLSFFSFFFFWSSLFWLSCCSFMFRHMVYTLTIVAIGKWMEWGLWHRRCLVLDFHMLKAPLNINRVLFISKWPEPMFVKAYACRVVCVCVFVRLYQWIYGSNK